MELSVSYLEILDCPGMFSFKQGDLDPRQVVGRELASRIAQGNDFERRAHLGNLFHRPSVERSNSNAPTWYGGNQMFGLKLPKGLPHRDVASVELARNLILPKRCTRLQCAADNALGDRPRNALCNRPIRLAHRRLSIMSRRGAECIKAA